jgi:phosphoribosyl 1,2-cyclic phosphate phosphodiesterase
MDLLFLGTAASEAIPSPFCRCAYCAKARQNGGKDIRTRSCFRIDGRHQIDFSPDIVPQITRAGLDLFDLEHIIITHTHDDHFDMAEIIERECAAPEPTAPVYLYMNKRGVAWARALVAAYGGGKDAQSLARFLDTYRFIPTDYFETFRAGDLQLTSLKANHMAFGPDEYGQNYIVALPDGRKLLYALDTGWYGDETWEFLQGRSVDLLAMDCTFGGSLERGIHPGGHLDIRSMLLMLEKLSAIGVISNTTQLYATHFNHKHTLMHEDMQKAFDGSGFPVVVAYDGLRMK